MLIVDVDDNTDRIRATSVVQFKLEVEEVDEASSELARYRQDVSQPLIIQVGQMSMYCVTHVDALFRDRQRHSTRTMLYLDPHITNMGHRDSCLHVGRFTL